MIFSKFIESCYLCHRVILEHLCYPKKKNKKEEEEEEGGGGRKKKRKRKGREKKKRSQMSTLNPDPLNQKLGVGSYYEF